MKHIPNILSALRIVLIPVFVVLIVQDRMLAAAAVLLASGLTDLLDGLLARSFGWVSDLGKVLDPAADKLTQITVCVVMIIELHRYWPVFVILLAKDAVMLLLGGGLYKKGVRLEGAKWFGKVATFAFYGVMVVLLFFPAIPQPVVTVLLIAVAALSILSGLLYIPQYLQYRQELGKESEATHEP